MYRDASLYHYNDTHLLGNADNLLLKYKNDMGKMMVITMMSLFNVIAKLTDYMITMMQERELKKKPMYRGG